MTRYGFRRHPYHSRVDLGVRYSTRWADIGVRLRGEYLPAHPELGFVAELEGSRIDALRFYGFGNETVDDLPTTNYVVRRETVGGRLEARYTFAEGVTGSAGVVGRYSRPWAIPGSPLDAVDPLGSTAFSAAGFTSGIFIDSGDDAPRRSSYRVSVEGSAFPFTSESDVTFGTVESSAGLRVPFGGAGAPSVAARIGARYAFGEFPFYEASFLGGLKTLRGFPQWRYAGQGMMYGGAEAMVPIARLPLGLNWQAAAFVFGDAGRVFLEGEESERWHTAPGAGISLTALTYTVRLSYAHGPRGRVYLEVGSPY